MATEVLTTTITPDLKGRVISEFWGVTNRQAGSGKDKRLVERYSEYYSKQVHLMLYDGGQNAPIWTHSDVVDVMTRIRNSHDRQEISSHLQSRLNADGTTVCGDMVDRLIDLGARLCLMTSFGKAPFAAERQISVEWIQGNAKEVLHQHFTQQTVADVEPKFKLPKIFTARNIHCIGGIQIGWTPYLSEHTGKDETIRTLALLFPRNDTDTKRWIQSLSDADVFIRKCGQLGADARKIENFRFWRDRLMILKEIFDEAEPKNLSQLWFDRRKRVQWYTFWVAVLVFVLAMFFGLVQSVEGALQVYMASRSD